MSHADVLAWPALDARQEQAGFFDSTWNGTEAVAEDPDVDAPLVDLEDFQYPGRRRPRSSRRRGRPPANGWRQARAPETGRTPRRPASRVRLCRGKPGRRPADPADAVIEGGFEPDHVPDTVYGGRDARDVAVLLRQALFEQRYQPFEGPGRISSRSGASPEPAAAALSVGTSRLIRPPAGRRNA